MIATNKMLRPSLAREGHFYDQPFCCRVLAAESEGTFLLS
jgi:hypothetical protein